MRPLEGKVEVRTAPRPFLSRVTTNLCRHLLQLGWCKPNCDQCAPGPSTRIAAQRKSKSVREGRDTSTRGEKLLTCVWPKPRFTNSVLAIPEAGSVATYAKSIPPCGLLKIDM